MIYRKFNKLRLTRTYIGGSKQRELELFAEVQGTKVNWLEYRRIFTEYSNDVLNIILSWKHISRIISYIFLGIAGLISFVNIGVALVLMLTSICFHLAYRYLTHKEEKMLAIYNYSFDVILSEIKQETGFVFDRN